MSTTFENVPWRAIKYVASCNDDVLPENTDPSKPIRYIDIGNVQYLTGIISYEEMLFGSAPSRARRLLRAGDVIISTVRTYLKAIAIIHPKDADAVASTGFAVLRPRRSVTTSFFGYALQSGPVIDAIVANSTGVSYPAIAASDLTGLKIPVPSLSDQERLADLLDRETAKADALVAKYERLIELLEEKRVALITQAVTKGLNPTVPMKDSGIEWIGEIPEHWQLVPLKYVARLKTGHTPSRQVAAYWENCDIPWVSLSDVYALRDGAQDYISETAECISRLGLANSAAELLPKDTVILSRTASVGFAAIISSEMATTQDFVNWVCSSLILPRLLLHIFRGMKQEFRRLTNGSVHQTIYMPDVNAFRVPLPPIEEQIEIDSHVTQQSALIFEILHHTKDAIALIKERRSAVITAAVTGQIDVSNQKAALETMA